ncbi:MAG: nucleotide-binding protein [Acidobacteriota bacterium]|nr:nucleotide-binding protein [Acidobacteriota bacterium]
MPSFERSVFLNYPYDKSFEPLLYAIVLTIVSRGFIPRSAREDEGQAELRMTRIARGLMTSKYSIHDLSRYRADASNQLPRFNMPLELGMAVGLYYERRRVTQPNAPRDDEPNWLALVPKNHVHQKYISDLAGFDLGPYDSVWSVIVAVAAWLVQQLDFRKPSPTANTIHKAYPSYRGLVDKLRKEEGRLTWPMIVDSAVAIAATLV